MTEAWDSRQPARIGVGTGRAEGIGVNRRTPDKQPIDDQIGLLRVDDDAGRTRGVLVNYACHPTVLGPDNLLVTGDFPSYTIDEIERALVPGGVAMFINGTQGNISVGHSSELSAIGIITPGRTFERAAAIGSALGRAALAALPRVTTASRVRLNSISTSAELPLKSYARRRGDCRDPRCRGQAARQPGRPRCARRRYRPRAHRTALCVHHGLLCRPGALAVERSPAHRAAGLSHR